MRRGAFPQGFLRWLLRLCALIPCVAVLFLLGFLIVKGAPQLGLHLLFDTVPPLDALLGRRPVWDGLWPACAGTLYLVGLTMALALFPGVGCGLYLAEFAPPRQAARIRLAMDVLAGTPSIVMGLFGFTLILFLRHSVWPGANTSLLLSACCLALLVLPVVVTTTSEALEAVPGSLRITGAALGFTRRQLARRVLLPTAGPGIWGGIILATGRAAEDTAVIMLTGVVANAGLPAGLADKFEALPFSIYYISAQYQDNDELLRGFGAALVLLLLSAALLLCSRWLENRFRRRWQGVS